MIHPLKTILKSKEELQFPQSVLVHKLQTAGPDHRTDPDDSGLNAGQKAAATRAMRYGDELKFAKGDKAGAVKEYQESEAGHASMGSKGAAADDPLSMQKNKSRQS